MSEEEKTWSTGRSRYLVAGLAIGMPACGLIGSERCIATDNPGLLRAGPAIDLTLGIAIGEGLYRRSRQCQDKAQ